MDEFTSKNFQGFAMQDTKHLPNLKKNPAMYILNSDTEAGKGEHWCVVYYKGDQVEFFDPFGMPASFYDFEGLLKSKQQASAYLYNPHCMQNPFSNVCGHHCLFYAFNQSRGVSFQQILQQYG
jgi:hypothetical protein